MREFHDPSQQLWLNMEDERPLVVYRPDLLFHKKNSHNFNGVKKKITFQNVLMGLNYLNAEQQQLLF